jgi:hypothetical protein
VASLDRAAGGCWLATGNTDAAKRKTATPTETQLRPEAKRRTMGSASFDI